jgi:hypothetical protein
MHAKTLSAFVICSLAVFAQQPNSGNHSMTINGIDGPPFPIVTNNVRTSTAANFQMTGATNQPYAIFQGNLGTGSLFIINSIVDLALSPFPVTVIDGFQNPTYKTDLSGTSGFSVQVPGVGVFPNGVPLGLQVSLQALIGDPFNSPFGLSLTAATKITVVQGPTVTLYSLGDESVTAISMSSLPIPFYGTSYTQIQLCSNGYVTMGANGVSDFTPTDSEMNSGPPRIAPFWTDLDCGYQAVKTTLDTNPGNGLPGYMTIEFNNVIDFGNVVQHTFSLTMKADGNVQIHSAASNNPSVYDSITGIGPGNSLGLPQTQKNFVGPQPAGSSVGPGILTTPPFALVGTVNMSFFEWFGIIANNAYYLNPYNNQFDIFGQTINFQASGSGALPGASNLYIVY